MSQKTPLPAGRPDDGRKRRWAQHNADRRAHVIDAALAVLDRNDDPGGPVTAQQIADEAGIHRTGIYRYFEDKTDLDVAIQREICDRLQANLSRAVVLEGQARTAVHRVVDTYVRWVVAHPSWTRFAERAVPGATENPMADVVGRIAELIEFAVDGFLALVGAELDSDDQRLTGPWVAGLISGCMASVRAWEGQGPDSVSLDQVVAFLSDTVWIQILGLASSRGITMPETPLEALFADPESTTSP